MSNFSSADSIVKAVESDDDGNILCQLSDDIFSSVSVIMADLRTKVFAKSTHNVTAHERSDEIVKGSLLAVHKLLTMLWIMCHIDTPHPIDTINEEFAEFREMMKQAQELVDEGDV